MQALGMAKNTSDTIGVICVLIIIVIATIYGILELIAKFKLWWFIITNS